MSVDGYIPKGRISGYFCLIQSQRSEPAGAVAAPVRTNPDALDQSAQVLALTQEIRQAAGGIPVLFTRRSSSEGGEKVAQDEEGVLALYDAVMASRGVELIDYEMSNDPVHVASVRAQASANS